MCWKVIFEEFRISLNVIACARLCSTTCWRLPSLASDENLAGVHDAAGQAGRVDGAQRRAELDDVGPDQGLGEQARVLPGGWGFVLTCTGGGEMLLVTHHFCNKTLKFHEVFGHSFHFFSSCFSP